MHKCLNKESRTQEQIKENKERIRALTTEGNTHGFPSSER